MTTRIQISEETAAKLATLQREGESYEEVLSRLLAAHEERDLLAGFGILEGTEAAEKVRASHEAMDRDMSEHIDGFRTEADRSGNGNTD